MFSILVAEDDCNLNRMICAKLKQEQYHVFSAYDGQEALDIMEREHIDLVISDVMMPRMDGLELTSALRGAKMDLPILIITAKGQMEDMERGFRAGTDDYMVKPIDINEMILRVGALLRRAKLASDKKLTIGSCVLDYDAVSISVGGGPSQTIPQKEFMLLFKLLSYPDKIFTRRELLDEIWGMDHDVDERTVDVHVKRVRERYRDCDDFEIVTVRGLGYKAKRLK